MEERVVCGPVGIAPSVEMFATIWSAEPRLRFDHALALPYPSRIGRLCSVIRQSGGSGCIGLACRRTRWFGAIGRNNGIPVMISEQCAIPFFSFPRRENRGVNGQSSSKTLRDVKDSMTIATETLDGHGPTHRKQKGIIVLGIWSRERWDRLNDLWLS